MATQVIAENTEPDAFIGVDVGGTHTDVQVMWGRRQARGKALTTYDDFSAGVLEAVGVAARELDADLVALLSATKLFVNATTVVTNTITSLTGARVGVLVTAGFKDEFRFAGGPRLRVIDDHQQTNVPDLVDRRDLIEIDERIDHAGTVLTALNADQVEAAAEKLLTERGVDAIAVCFLSSYANADHENRAAQIIAARYPDVFVTTSSSVSSVLGEYPRWITAVLNAFVNRDADIFLTTLGTRLHEAGLAGRAVFYQGLGGGISAARASRFPLALLGAGPAAGAAGASDLARRMGFKRVLLGDMGGTSFDTGVIYDNEVHIDTAVQIGRFRTRLPLVDVVSVGAGGGSVAWISERGVPQVGPRSAGSTPGPAAYAKGGTEPTVTDAMVVMGLLDPENYLGGRMTLDRAAAEEALSRQFGKPLGLDLDQAAGAVHDLVVTNMATAVRQVSVNRGFDPRDFVFLAYGGTLPFFAVEIARALKISTVVVPHNSSVFCARGLLVSDFVLRYDRSIKSVLDSPDELRRVNAEMTDLVNTATRELAAEGFRPEDISITRRAEFQYLGQVHALPIPLPDRDLTPHDVTELGNTFTAVYERTYGEGTAWPNAPKLMLNHSVTATGSLAHPDAEPPARQPAEQVAVPSGEREVYLAAQKQRRTVPIYAEQQFTAGSRCTGPAIIESVDTTLYVPPGVAARRDEHLNFIISLNNEV